MYELSCPHCNGGIIVQRNELNCRIFRHGVYLNMQPMNPPSKEECDRLVQTNQIIGCGKPFRVINGPNRPNGATNLIAIKCDYI